MKNLIEETLDNLLIIKEKICYKDSEGSGCYKCPFGEDTDSGFECSLSDERLKEIIDDAIHELKTELYETIGVEEEDND